MPSPRYFRTRACSGAYLADYVGLRRIPAIRIESGDGSSGIAVLEAYNMVKAGIYDCVAVVGVEKMHDVVNVKLNKALSTITDYEYEGFFGGDTGGTGGDGNEGVHDQVWL